jgi:hypothetical protein
MMMPTMNGNPLDPEISARRAADYRDLLEVNRVRSGGEVEAGQIIRAGLNGGISPDDIAVELSRLGVDAERIGRLMGRAVEQLGYQA